MLLGNTGYILTVKGNNTRELKYLLGFLNSRVILYYLDLICTRFDDNGWRWLRQFVETIPIPINKSTKSFELIDIVNGVNKHNQKKCSPKINNLVAEIYGLTENELSYINRQLNKY